MSRTLASPASPGATRLRIAARVAAALLGGYALAWGLIAAGMALLFAAGMEFHDAEFLANVLGLLAFLAVFLWAFAARRVAVAWWVTLGGGAVLAATGSLAQSALA